VTDRETPFLSPLRHRVLQIHGRRYSVRLEEAYWAVLEELAGERSLRLAEIIDEVAVAAEGEASLASALRLRCLGAITEKLADSQTASRFPAGVGGGRYGTSLENLITANPAPSLLVADDAKIMFANVGLEETIDNLVRGAEGYQPARLSYIAPGRVVVANGVVCLGHYGGPRDYTWIIMIGNVAAPAGRTPAP
jgi:predicted DNA-binding ribbon-helix-helix protein